MEDGVSMVWHYNAFLSYAVEPVKEELVWLDTETANLTQVDLNAYFLENGTPGEDAVFEQIKLADQLYANALAFWEDDDKKDQSLDKRA